MTLMAAFALALAVICGVAGWFTFGEDMTVNIVSGLMELFLGGALAVLIIERVNRGQARRDWAVAYEVINGLLAASFVDIMRLMHVRVVSYHSDDRRRYGEFVQVSAFHAAALRSAIEGFATALEPRSHQLIRAAELRLSWLTQKLSDEASPCPAEEYLQRAYEIAEDIAELFMRQGDSRYDAARKASTAIARRFIGRESRREKLSTAIGWRYPAQTQLLRDLGITSASGRYIFDDMDNNLAIAYFALDRELLSAAHLSSAHRP